MKFHVWSDGILGGPDSFNDNAEGLNIPGHTGAIVNSPLESFIRGRGLRDNWPARPN